MLSPLFVILLNYHDDCVMYYWYDVINANKMIHNELVLLVCFSTVDDMNLLIWSNPIHYQQSNILITLLVYQYCTKFWKKITILEQICIPVLCTILVYQYCDRQVQEIRKRSLKLDLFFNIFTIWNSVEVLRFNLPTLQIYI
jgi:hypothetical protein